MQRLRVRVREFRYSRQWSGVRFYYAYCRQVFPDFVSFIQESGRISRGETVSLMIVYHANVRSRNMLSFFSDMELETELAIEYLHAYSTLAFI